MIHSQEILRVPAEIRAHRWPGVGKRTRQGLAVFEDVDASSVVQKDSEHDGEMPYLQGRPMSTQ